MRAWPKFSTIGHPVDVYTYLKYISARLFTLFQNGTSNRPTAIMKQDAASTAAINKGLHVPTQKVRFITDVDKTMRGSACNCICFGCGEPLIAALGEVNIDHFRHAGASECSGGQETAIHEAAKEILVEKCFINTKRFGTIHFTGAFAEEQLASKRPDVTAVFQDRPIYFEIAVTHFIDKEKRNFYIEGKQRSIEIDLSKLNRLALKDEIEKAVLHASDNKTIIYWEPEVKPPIPGSTEDKPHPLAIIAIIIAVGFAIYNAWNWLFGRKRK